MECSRGNGLRYSSSTTASRRSPFPKGEGLGASRLLYCLPAGRRGRRPLRGGGVIFSEYQGGNGLHHRHSLRSPRRFAPRNDRGAVNSTDLPGCFLGLALLAEALIRHGFAVPPSPKGEGLGEDKFYSACRRGNVGDRRKCLRPSPQRMCANLAVFTLEIREKI